MPDNQTWEERWEWGWMDNLAQEITQECLDDLRKEIAELREEVARLKKQQQRIQDRNPVIGPGEQ